jgi:hypothetical protein
MKQLFFLFAFIFPVFAEEKPEDLPDFKGREEVFYMCAACHSFNLVSKQGMSRERWASTFTLMVEKHAMAPVTGKDLDEMLDYLAKIYPEKPATGFKNPFAP